MAIYSIRDLEKLTGIKKHTIRIWEQRYRLITPHRTNTNIRYYTDNELRRLFNIALLNRNGFKISKLAQIGHEEIAHLVAGIAERNENANTQIDALTLAMLNLDEHAFENIFATSIHEHGFEKTMATLIYPLLENLKALWITRSINPAHEKFITHLIRRKVLRAIDEIDAPDRRDNPVFFLYLPDGEMQELTLLFINYLLRQRGFQVIYLGSGTSISDIRDACSAVPPGYVFSIIEAPLPRQSVQSYVDHAAAAVGKSQLLLTGSQVFMHPLKLPPNVTLVNGLPDTLTLLDRLKSSR
jgi:MerR family transcriptional regulator, light-induced transcriptional regulator